MNQMNENFKYDGIIDESKFGAYEDSKLKILWILKEPNLKDMSKDWSLVEFLSDRENRLFKYKYWYMTWGFVVKTSWGILNNIADWNKIPRAKGIANILDYIAVININKKGGGKSTDMLNLYIAFRKPEVHNTIVQEINDINPDIVIGGSTLSLFYHNGILFNTEHGKIDFDGDKIWGCRKEDRLWIDGYHPNQKKITQITYYEHIIKEIKH